MSKETQAVSQEVETLAADARALIAATAEVAGQQVQKARKRLAVALEAGKEGNGRMHQKAVRGAKKADQLVRDYAYPDIAIGAGVGAVLGFIVARRWASGQHPCQEPMPPSSQ